MPGESSGSLIQPKRDVEVADESAEVSDQVRRLSKDATGHIHIISSRYRPPDATLSPDEIDDSMMVVDDNITPWDDAHGEGITVYG